MFNKSTQDLKKLKKEELLDIILTMKESSGSDQSLLSILKGIKETVEQLREEIKLLKVENEILKTNTTANKVDNDIVMELKKENCRLDQYVRRNNVELSGIPEIFGDNVLEDKVIEIGAALDVAFTSADIEACHRLDSKKRHEDNSTEPRRVIVRFANRRFVEKLVANKKNIKKDDLIALGFPEESSLYINENLCPAYRSLWGKCRKLKKAGTIKYVWTTKGTVRIRRDDNSSQHKIEHISDLTCLFPDFDFN